MSDEIAAADERLRKAIIDCVEVRGWKDSKVLVDYVVLAARTGFDSDGSAQTTYNYLVDDNTIPIHRVLGLLSIFEKILSNELSDDYELGGAEENDT